ncbi:hypothetical protein FACS189491_02170 [Spirochaetia bacterium]|nr:hypothetical protein FACS189491_02170 [Spirochaetia bacterium]
MPIMRGGYWGCGGGGAGAKTGEGKGGQYKGLPKLRRNGGSLPDTLFKLRARIPGRESFKQCAGIF